MQCRGDALFVPWLLTNIRYGEWFCCLLLAIMRATDSIRRAASCDNVHPSHRLQSLYCRKPEEGVACRGPQGPCCQQLRQPGVGAYQPARPADAALLDGGGASLLGLGVGVRGGGSVLEGSPSRRCPPGRMDVAKISTRVLWFP